MNNLNSLLSTIALSGAMFDMQIMHAQNMSGGGYHTLFRCSDGTVMATGLNGPGQLGDGTNFNRTSPVPVLSLTGIIAVSAGYQHSLALKGDGTAWSFGNNSYGELGHGNTLSINSALQIASLSDITAISGGALHSLFLKSDGTVWACGYNFHGELGDGTNTNRAIPA